MRSGVHLIAKAPIPGWCNTRLIDGLGEERAAELQRVLIEDHLNALRSYRCERHLWLGLPPGTTEFDSFGETDVTAVRSSDLGAVLSQALAAGRELHQWEGAVFWGVDAPLAAIPTLDRAMHALQPSKGALGPTVDGGIYMMAIPASWRDPFPGVCWGTSEVFAALKKNGERAEIEIEILPIGRDIDTPIDFDLFAEQVRTRASLAPRTAALVGTWNERRVE